MINGILQKRCDNELLCGLGMETEPAMFSDPDPLAQCSFSLVFDRNFFEFVIFKDPPNLSQRGVRSILVGFTH
jgi:hypothetical protein